MERHPSQQTELGSTRLIITGELLYGIVPVATDTALRTGRVARKADLVLSVLVTHTKIRRA